MIINIITRITFAIRNWWRRHVIDTVPEDLEDLF